MILAAGKFKAQCLKLMDLVKEKGERIIITKRGKPIAQLVPIEEAKKITLFGYLKGSVIEEKDIVSPTGEPWEVNGDEC